MKTPEEKNADIDDLIKQEEEEKSRMEELARQKKERKMRKHLKNQKFNDDVEDSEEEVKTASKKEVMKPLMGSPV